MSFRPNPLSHLLILVKYQETIPFFCHCERILILFNNLLDAVSQALSEQTGIKIFGQAVDSVPKSGKPSELLDLFGLSASKIAEKVKKLI